MMQFQSIFIYFTFILNPLATRWKFNECNSNRKWHFFTHIFYIFPETALTSAGMERASWWFNNVKLFSLVSGIGRFRIVYFGIEKDFQWNPLFTN